MVLQSFGLEEKKVDKIGESFILLCILDKAGHRKPGGAQRIVIVIQLQQLFLGEVIFVGSLKHLLVCVSFR